MVIFYDLETTGLNQFHDKITEMCFHKYESLNHFTKYSELVNPEVNISYFITNLTGISNEMVLNKPNFTQQTQNLLQFISNSQNTNYLVAHNNDGFDKIVLKDCDEFGRVGKSILISIFDFNCLDLILYKGLSMYSSSLTFSTFSTFSTFFSFSLLVAVLLPFSFFQ